MICLAGVEVVHRLAFDICYGQSHRFGSRLVEAQDPILRILEPNHRRDRVKYDLLFDALPT